VNGCRPKKGRGLPPGAGAGGKQKVYEFFLTKTEICAMLPLSRIEPVLAGLERGEERESGLRRFAHNLSAQPEMATGIFYLNRLQRVEKSGFGKISASKR
jgi:hypothetical protein